MFLRLGVPIADAAEGIRTFGPLRSRQLDGLIGGQALLLVDRAALHHPVIGVFLLPGDEEDPPIGQGAKPAVIEVAQVHGDDGALGQAQAASPVDLVLPGLVNSHKRGKIAIVVEEDLELDAGLGLAVRSPGKERQAQLHHRGVERVELVLKLEFVRRRPGQTALIDLPE